jgi:galactonate dehydratase
VIAAVEEMKDYLIGKDPLRIEDHFQVLYRGGFYRGGEILMSAISGIDQALWDIKGKYLRSARLRVAGRGGPRQDSCLRLDWRRPARRGG